MRGLPFVIGIACFVLLLAFSEAHPCKRPPPKAKHSQKHPPPSKSSRPSPKRTPSPSPPPSPDDKPHVTVTVFGDSLSDNGSNEFPRMNYLMPDPDYYDHGRCSNGPVWVEYLANVTEGKVADVFNFAYVEASACHQFLPFSSKDLPPEQAPLALGNQTSRYLAERSALIKKGVKNVAIVFIGVNDLFTVFTSNDSAGGQKTLVGCITDGVARLAQAGETEIVVFNIPPLEGTPFVAEWLEPKLLPFVGFAVRGINAALATALTKLRHQLNGTANITFFDTYTTFSQDMRAANTSGVITTVPCLTTTPPKQPPEYGRFMPNVTIHTCGNRTEDYYFYDSIHPSTSVHGRIAKVLAGMLTEKGVW